jgi:hypothetical protein
VLLREMTEAEEEAEAATAEEMIMIDTKVFSIF